MKRVIFINLFLSILIVDVSAQNAETKTHVNPVSGVVFEDTNGNGAKDNNEPGIKGVIVSDEINVVVTNDEGFYQLPAVNGYGIVNVTIPDGYKAVNSFWQAVDVSNDKSTISFALSKLKSPKAFTFIHASDTHVSPASVGRMKKFEHIVDSVKPDFVIITGDLVKDALRVPEQEAKTYYDLFQIEKNKITSPVWTIPGNHEIFGIERHLSLVSSSNPLYGRKMYRHYFGPDYFSFNYGGIHFVGLNSLDFEDLWYYGKIDSTQIEWLKKDIALVSPQTPVVTFQHVPFYSGGLSMEPFEEAGPGRVIEREKGVMQYRHTVSNSYEVMDILKDHNFPLALAGHHHYQQKFSMAGIQTRFEQTAAIIAPTEDGILKMP
ncbi:MAG: metallophosphoesterase, partial [Bacteroidota bacterium]